MQINSSKNIKQTKCECPNTQIKPFKWNFMKEIVIIFHVNIVI